LSRSPTNNPASRSSPSAATLWLLDGELIDNSRLASFEVKLEVDERLRHQRFLRPARAREFLLGRLLLRHAARHLLGPAAVRVDVVEREHQAPLVSFPEFSATPVFHFSISHSRGWIACLASTTCAVGLDIENQAHARDVNALSSAAFDDAQRQWLAALDMPRRVQGFYRLWNNHEALYKLRGNSSRETDPTSYGAGWNCFHVDHPHLHIGVCAAQELAPFDIVEVSDLNSPQYFQDISIFTR
jgi:4'-phosphopantetheinyl transferase